MKAGQAQRPGQGCFRVGVVRVCRGNVSGNALFVGKSLGVRPALRVTLGYCRYWGGVGSVSSKK